MLSFLRRTPPATLVAALYVLIIAFAVLVFFTE